MRALAAGRLRNFFIAGETSGKRKSASASSSRTSDTGRVKKMDGFPLERIRLRRNEDSVSSPSTMATTSGERGYPNFLNRNPITPKTSTIHMVKSVLFSVYPPM